jgi:hypothetical protein
MALGALPAGAFLATSIPNVAGEVDPSTFAAHPLASRDFRRRRRVHCIIAGRHGARTLVAGDRCSTGRDQIIHQRERRRFRAVAEKPLAVAQCDRERECADLVEQIAGQ